MRWECSSLRSSIGNLNQKTFLSERLHCKPGGWKRSHPYWNTLICNCQNLPIKERMYGGRQGYHTEFLQPLLDEMTEVYRLDPISNMVEHISNTVIARRKLRSEAEQFPTSNPLRSSIISTDCFVAPSSLLAMIILKVKYWRYSAV